MPQSLQAERKALQMLAARALGLNGYWARVFGIQVKALGHETDLVRLPTNPYAEPLMDENGDMRFVAGVSVAGGPDPA